MQETLSNINGNRCCTFNCFTLFLIAHQRTPFFAILGASSKISKLTPGWSQRLSICAWREAFASWYLKWALQYLKTLLEISHYRHYSCTIPYVLLAYFSVLMGGRQKQALQIKEIKPQHIWAAFEVSLLCLFNLLNQSFAIIQCKYLSRNIHCQKTGTFPTYLIQILYRSLSGLKSICFLKDRCKHAHWLLWVEKNKPCWNGWIVKGLWQSSYRIQTNSQWEY